MNSKIRFFTLLFTSLIFIISPLLSQHQIGNDIDGEAIGDLFGGAAALSANGMIMAAGAPRNDGNGTDSGHVRVYEYNGSHWIQLGNDIDGERGNNYAGISVSLSDNGKIVAIGATLNSDRGSSIGQVQVFQFINGNWTQLGRDLYGEARLDNFGSEVSLSSDGTIVAVGAAGNDGNGENSGHVRVFQYNGSDWRRLGNDIDGEAAGDRSGTSDNVSLSSDGTIVAIGADTNDGNGENSGHVRIFQFDGNDWVQLGSDIDGETARDRSGSLALSSDGMTVVIGAESNSPAGHTRVFRYNGNDWVQIGNDIDGETNGDASGTGVAISGDGTRIVIAGIFNDGENGERSGHARIFQYDGSDWVQLGIDLDGEAANDRFSESVALSRDGMVLAVGGTFNDGNGENSGHVRVFGGSPLPVELVFFEGKSIGKHNLLAWQTVSEIDNQGFSIEKSTDGKTWQEIGFVNGYGNSIEPRNYSFVDKLPINLINYYHLKQIDFDGSFEYSKIIVLASKKENIIKVSPNPIHDILYYEVDDFSKVQQLQLLDLNGRVILSTNIIDGNVLIDNVMAGIYVLSIQINKEEFRELIIKQ